MKRIILGALLLGIQSFSLVWADVTQDVQNYLNQGKKFLHFLVTSNYPGYRN